MAAALFAMAAAGVAAVAPSREIVAALFLILFTDVRLSIALMTGASGMILAGVLRIEEACRAVSWKSVFLPTRQANALIMGPAGYRVADFMRAGGIMPIPSSRCR